MIAWLLAAASAVLFLLLLQRFGVIGRGREALMQAQAALGDLRNPELDDLAKEKALQAHSGRLFLSFFWLTLGMGAALALPTGLLWLLERGGLGGVDEVVGVMLSWPFIVATLGLIPLLLWWRRR